MTSTVVFLAAAPIFMWTVHDLQAFAEQYVAHRHAND